MCSYKTKNSTLTRLPPMLLAIDSKQCVSCKKPAHKVYQLQLTMTLSKETTSAVSWKRLNGGAVWHSRKKFPRSPVDVPECDAKAGFWDKQQIIRG